MKIQKNLSLTNNSMLGLNQKGSRGSALLSHTEHVRYGRPATLTRVPRFKPSQINSKLWALLLYHQCSILTKGISRSSINHVDRTRSMIRVPWEKRWESDVKSNPRAFNLDASLLPCNLPLSFFLAKSSVALGEEEVGGWVGWKETSLSRPKGYTRFYSPAHTGHVRYTWVGPNNSKKCFLSFNPLFYYFSVQKGI